MLGITSAMMALVVAGQTAPAGLPARPLVVSYSESVACAGLAQAGSELEGNESDRGRRLFDAALYWSLTTIQMGKASGRLDLQIERDLSGARIRAVRDLSRRTPEATEQLSKCVRAAPALG